MRLWSIHPKYLDQKGLITLWKDSLLAQSVLLGRTREYKNHPQLDRFRKSGDPLQMIREYLYHVHLEALQRGYDFSITHIYESHELVIKFEPFCLIRIGQVQFEKEILDQEITKRRGIPRVILPVYDIPKLHPCFELNSMVYLKEDWEKYDS
jgi:hypothetical protein